MLKARMASPVMIVGDAMKAMQALGKASEQGGVPHTTSLLVVLRASQINGCSVCVDMHSRELKRAERATSASSRSAHGAMPRSSPTPSVPPST